MKFYTFKRESNDFSDIVKDIGIKKYISTKLYWSNHLMIGLSYSTPESVIALVVLKYGEDISNPCARDFTPIPGKDYMPKRESPKTVDGQTQ